MARRWGKSDDVSLDHASACFLIARSSKERFEQESAWLKGERGSVNARYGFVGINLPLVDHPTSEYRFRKRATSDDSPKVVRALPDRRAYS